MNRFVADITREDLRALHQAIKATGAGVSADRCLAVVRRAFGYAMDLGWRADNPAADLRIAKSGAARTAFLDGEHLQALGEALRRAEEKGTPCWQATAMVRLLLASGLRLSEVLTLAWRELDLRRGTLTKRDHKTSARTGDLVQPLSAEALDLLRDIAARKGAKLSPWVLPSDLDPRKHFNGAQKAWQVIREDAGLEAFHLHDLRRSFASWAALTGVDLATASKLLNHSDVSITSKIYAQADLNTKRTAADTIASGIGAALRGVK